MSNPREFPSDKADKFVVRFPDGMRDMIAEAAKANGRSMNAEVLSRLLDTFDPDHATSEVAVLALELDKIAAEKDRDYERIRAVTLAVALKTAEPILRKGMDIDSGDGGAASIRFGLAEADKLLAEDAVLPDRSLLDLRDEKLLEIKERLNRIIGNGSPNKLLDIALAAKGAKPKE